MHVGIEPSRDRADLVVSGVTWEVVADRAGSDPRRPRGVTDPAQPAVRTLPYWSTVMIAVSFLRFSAR